MAIVHGIPSPVSRNKNAVAAMVTGVAAALMAVVAMGWLGVLAVYFGRKGRAAAGDSEAERGAARMARAGEILGWVAIGLTLLLLAGYSGAEDTYFR